MRAYGATPALLLRASTIAAHVFRPSCNQPKCKVPLSEPPTVEVDQKSVYQLLRPDSQPLQSHDSDGAAASLVAAELQAAIAEVAAELGCPEESIAQQAELLQLLLPDWMPLLASIQATTGRWRAITAAVAAVSSGANQAVEMQLLGDIVQARRAGGNDDSLELTQLHNPITLAVTSKVLPHCTKCQTLLFKQHPAD